jgi:hypothetical protein
VLVAVSAPDQLYAQINRRALAEVPGKLTDELPDRRLEVARER